MVLASEIKALEILKRAKSGGEVVSFLEDENNVKEEVLKRSAKAGHFNCGSTGSGKGDARRPIDEKLYRENYVKIFGHN